jgi:hypothetical protein
MTIAAFTCLGPTSVNQGTDNLQLKVSIKRSFSIRFLFLALLDPLSKTQTVVNENSLAKKSPRFTLAS